MVPVTKGKAAAETSSTPDTGLIPDPGTTSQAPSNCAASSSVDPITVVPCSASDSDSESDSDPDAAFSLASLADQKLVRVKIVRQKTIKRTTESKTVRTCIHTGAVIEEVVTKEYVRKIYTVTTIKKSDIKE